MCISVKSVVEFLDAHVTMERYWCTDFNSSVVTLILWKFIEHWADKNRAYFLLNNLFHYWSKWETLTTKFILLFTNSYKKIIFKNIQLNFDIENWLWKLQNYNIQEPLALLFERKSKLSSGLSNQCTKISFWSDVQSEIPQPFSL